MKITNFYYGTLLKGAGAGSFGFDIHLEEEGESSPIDILKIIRSTTTSPVKIIRFHGSGEEGEMISLCKTLGDMGFILQAISDGSAFYKWFHYAHHLIVSISSPVWLGFNCQELWMQANQEVSLSDPTLPGGKIQGTLFYILPGGDPNEIYRYVLSSKIPWAIAPKPMKAIKQNLIEEE